jgi:hypothetical protein
MKLKEIVRTESNLGRVQVERNPGPQQRDKENLLVNLNMLDKKMTVEDDLSTTAPKRNDLSTTAPKRNLVEFNSSLTTPSSPNLKIAKTEVNILKTATSLLRKTTRKMTPAKKKMLSQTRNSPMARTVARNLGLTDLPCVRSIASRIDLQQPPRLSEARNCGKVSNFIFTKPLSHS